MKRLFISLTIVAALASCKSNDDKNAQNRDIQLLSDSTAHTNTVSSDTPSTTAVAQPAPIVEKSSNTPVIDKNKSGKAPVTKTTPAQQPSQPSSQTVSTPVPEVTPPVATAPVPAKDSAVAATTGTGQDNGAANAGTTVEKKKGISKAAQGAIIGGAAGAVGGAIVSKKKGVGAAVGAVVGAAGGYIIGKNKDKKDTTTKK